MFYRITFSILALCAQSAIALVHNSAEIQDHLNRFMKARSSLTNLPELEKLSKSDAVVHLVDVDLKFITHEIASLQNLEREIEKQTSYFLESPFEKWKKELNLHDHYIYLPLKEDRVTLMDFVSNTDANDKTHFGKLRVAVPSPENTPNFDKHLPRLIQLFYIYIRMNDMRLRQNNPAYHETHFEAPLYQATMFSWIEMLRILEKKYATTAYVDEIEEAKCTGKCKYEDKQELRQAYWQIELAHTSDPTRMKSMELLETLRKQKEAIIFPKGVPQSLKRPAEELLTPESYIMVDLKPQFRDQTSKNSENNELLKKCNVDKKSFEAGCWNSATSILRGPKVKQLLVGQSITKKKKPSALSIGDEETSNMSRRGSKLFAAPSSLTHSPRPSIHQLLPSSEDIMLRNPSLANQQRENQVVSARNSLLASVNGNPSLSLAQNTYVRTKEELPVGSRDGTDDMELKKQRFRERMANVPGRNSLLPLRNSQNSVGSSAFLLFSPNNRGGPRPIDKALVPIMRSVPSTPSPKTGRAQPFFPPAGSANGRLSFFANPNNNIRTKILDFDDEEKPLAVTRAERDQPLPPNASVRGRSNSIAGPNDDDIRDLIEQLSDTETPVNARAENAQLSASENTASGSTIEGVDDGERSPLHARPVYARRDNLLALPEIKYVGKERNMDAHIRRSFRLPEPGTQPIPRYRRSVDLTTEERKNMLDRMIKKDFKLTPRAGGPVPAGFKRKSAGVSQVNVPTKQVDEN